MILAKGRKVVRARDPGEPRTIWAFHHYEEGPQGHWTGTSDLYRPLAAAGHKVTIFASSFSHHARREEHLEPGRDVVTEVADGMRFVFVRTRPYQDYGRERVFNMTDFSRCAFRVAVADPERPDVVVGSTPHPLCALTAARTASCKGARFFLEIHDLWPFFMLEAKIWKAHHPAAIGLGLLERYLLRRADLVLYLWSRGEDYLAERGIPRDRTVWLPMGLSPERLAALPSDDPPPPPPFVVTYSGRLGATNAAEGILEAAAVLQEAGHDDIQIKLVSEGERKAEFQGRCKDLGLRNVIFESFVPRSEVLSNLASSHVLFGGLPGLPSYTKYGPIPTKLIDYLAVGRPIIYATDDPRHLLLEAGAGFAVQPGDPRALAVAILRLRDSTPQARAAMGRAAQEYLRRHHDVAKIAQRLVERV